MPYWKDRTENFQYGRFVNIKKREPLKILQGSTTVVRYRIS